MSLYNSLIRTIFSYRLRAIEKFRRDPIAVQAAQLSRLLEAGCDTPLGKYYGLSRGLSYQEFCQRVPVVTYEEFTPWIERVLGGEHSAISAKPTRWLAKSSGTTNDRSKFIPINSPSLQDCHFRGGRDVLALFTHLVPRSKALTGKALTLGGSHQLVSEGSSLLQGDLSAILIENTPSLISKMREPKRSVALMPSFDEKVEAICRSCSTQNVTSFAGVPSWNLVLMKRIMEYNKCDTLLDIWPNLSLFIHGGMSFDPYRDQYQKIIPSSQMSYFETYNASEGFFAMQDDLSDRSMLLMLDYGTFYEFLPFAELDHPEKAVPLEGVRTGVNYAMIITTIGGLWRYMIGDTVEFTSTRPYKIKITGRTKHFINAFGEELIIDNAESALKRACEVTGAQVEEYTVAPIFMDDRAKGAHHWVVEFSKEPKDIALFRETLDQAIRDCNSDYGAKRTDNTTMSMLELTVAPRGTFYGWMVGRGKLGGQNKVPRLSGKRDYLEGLLEIIKE
ncbi:MAG: GH3 auxin-responsive promoter family protein [Rikenellaceae bacterium]